MDDLSARLPDGGSIGVVGLGVGTIAAYERPADSMTFFEIDQAVIDIARDTASTSPTSRTHRTRRRSSSATRACHSRRSLDSSYDLLVLDAFSSDAVPAHLLTREAIDDLSPDAAAGWDRRVPPVEPFLRPRARGRLDGQVTRPRGGAVGLRPERARRRGARRATHQLGGRRAPGGHGAVHGIRVVESERRAGPDRRLLGHRPPAAVPVGPSGLARGRAPRQAVASRRTRGTPPAPPRWSAAAR